VAVHHDLTMQNVLVDNKGGLAVVDWETGQAEDFPLMDFFYTVYDAVAAVDGYTHRRRAIEACFMPDGLYADLVAQFQGQICRALEIPDEMVDLYFHSCWLHHAINEQNSISPMDQHPFFEIVQLCALRSFKVSR
jgi:hypothetical protein